jgi:hypothetical protein
MDSWSHQSTMDLQTIDTATTRWSLPACHCASPMLAVMALGEGRWLRDAHELQREAAEGLCWPGDEDSWLATKVFMGWRNRVRRRGFESRIGCGGEW